MQQNDQSLNTQLPFMCAATASNLIKSEMNLIKGTNLTRSVTLLKHDNLTNTADEIIIILRQMGRRCMIYLDCWKTGNHISKQIAQDIMIGNYLKDSSWLK